MKKIPSLLSVFSLLVLFSAAAQATDVRPYIDAHVGASVNRDTTTTSGSVSYDPGLAAGGAFGLDFDVLRIEANVDYRRSDISEINAAPVNGDLQLLSYMANLHLVAPIPLPVRPYILGGAGFATAFVDDSVAKQSNTKFAFQLGAGIGYDITRNVTLDANYRYLQTSDFNFTGSKFSYRSNNVLLGFRYLY